MARLIAVLLGGAAAAAALELDDMWLRRDLVADPRLRATYLKQMGSVAVVGDGDVSDAASLAQLRTVAAELGDGLTKMLGAPVPATCCYAAGAQLVVRVGRLRGDRGPEGFAVAAYPDAVAMEANTPSGALYGAFDLLGTVRRGEVVEGKDAAPKTDLRLWDLWDTLTGDITRGFSGFSVVWPMATWADPDVNTGNKDLLYVAPCDATDESQHWSGAFDGSKAAKLENRATGTCVGVANGLRAGDCGTAEPWWFNSTARDLSVGPRKPGVVGKARQCLDVNHAQGPAIDTYFSGVF